jgi:metallo-beta-lactamase family protein
MAVRVSFFGASGEVTGSCYLLETGRSRVLLECGMHQGPPEVEQLNQAPFPFDPRSLDAVVLSHAHLDHSGLLPRLVAEGFRGPIHCTTPTRGLLGILLRDAAHLAQRDVEWENRRRERAGRRPLEPLYTPADVDRVLAQSEPLDYGRETAVARDVRLRYQDAGHILGSAIVNLRIDDGGSEQRLAFSGDLGNPRSVLMADPAVPEAADLVIMEGTYGNRDHQSMESTVEELAGILADAHREGGNVLIPAFAVGRTQEVIYHLLLLRRQGRLPQSHVYLDSPMAIEVTDLYLRNLESLDRADLDRLLGGGEPGVRSLFALIQPTRSPQESMSLNRIRSGAVIIAGSGMCTGGRIRHHLKHNLWRRETRVVIVGFQAAGTLGRRLVDGAHRVHMLGEEIAVRGRIHTLGGYSAHAGRSELLDWAGGIGGRPRFFLVHGEPDALKALQSGLSETHGIRAEIPDYRETVVIG